MASPSRPVPAGVLLAGIAVAGLAILGLGCAGGGSPSPSVAPGDWRASSDGPRLGDRTTIAFDEVTEAVGLAGIAYPADLIEGKIIATMGGGVAWGDYDGDGDADLYVTQGIERYRPQRPATSCGLLFRNDSPAGFTEASAHSGIRACGWGSGAAFEDIDLDGDLDLFLTFVGDNQLWLNQGDGNFEEVAEEWGLTAFGYNSGAAFLDFDRDGDLDLYLTRYIETTIEAESAWPAHILRLPEDYAAPDNLLLRNDGAVRWSDETSSAGVANSEGRSLAVVAVDFDLDGWTDLFIANDRGSNTLLHNRGDATFEDVTQLAGVGVGPDGLWESAMGIAVADVDDNGFPDLLVTNYVDEPNSLFANLGELAFTDQTRSRGLYEAAVPWVAWGAEFVDFDNDGELDLYVVNGHIVPNWVSRIGHWFRRDKLVGGYTRGGYYQPVLLFRGSGGRFAVVDSGEDGLLGRRIAGRGGAAADFDGDGRLDLFVMSLSKRSPAALLRNRSESAGGWLQVELRGSASSSPAVGSTLQITSGERLRTVQLHSGGSYLSGSACPTHFGLAGTVAADLELQRPDGHRARFVSLERDHRYVIR